MADQLGRRLVVTAGVGPQVLAEPAHVGHDQPDQQMYGEGSQRPTQDPPLGAVAVAVAVALAVGRQPTDQRDQGQRARESAVLKRAGCPR